MTVKKNLYIHIAMILAFFFFVTILTTSPVIAEDVPPSRAAIQYSFAPVVKNVSPAVVNIYTSKRVQVQSSLSPFANDPFFQQFFGNRFHSYSLPQEQMVRSLGSGVIIQPDGLIVTSNHVVQDSDEITVLLADRREFTAKKLLSDSKTDLAFLQITDDGTFPHVEMRDSDTLEVGDLVLAMGNPFGVGQTVTSGIISALARTSVSISDYQFFIQTDAAINPGNSGGALVDMHGQLIGINTAIYSKTGASIGIGFAIPTNMVRAVRDNMDAGGKIVRPWLGVNVQPVTSEIADSLGLDRVEGVLVKKVIPNSSAEKAGLRVGDIILLFDGQAIFDEGGLNYRVALSRLGEEVHAAIVRSNERQDIVITMDVPPEVSLKTLLLEGEHPLAGYRVAEIDEAVMDTLSNNDGSLVPGILIMEAATSNRARGLFRRGDIIQKVNGKTVETVQALQTIMNSNTRHWQFIIMRAGARMNVTIRY